MRRRYRIDAPVRHNAWNSNSSQAAMARLILAAIRLMLTILVIGVLVIGGLLLFVFTRV